MSNPTKSHVQEISLDEALSMMQDIKSSQSSAKGAQHIVATVTRDPRDPKRIFSINLAEI
jgi:topoisomerase IA-like protein